MILVKHILQAGGIVLNSNGEVLVITSKAGKFTFPKGSREKGETSIDNAKREIEEESGLKTLNLKCRLGILIRPGLTAKNTSFPSVIKHIDMYFFTTKETELKPQDAAIADVQWMSLGRAEDILSWPEEVEFLKQNRAKLTL